MWNLDDLERWPTKAWAAFCGLLSATFALVDCLAQQRLDDQVEAENWDCTNSLLRAPRYSRATKEPETVDFRGNVCQQDTIGWTIVASVDG